MAQYKDIDAILNNLPNDLPYKASVKRVLIQAPAADVVPKSEYDGLKEMLDATIAGQETLQKALARAKAEVAREIFEELDNRLDDISVVSANGDGFTMGVGKTFEKVTGIVEELKEKYTEGR